MTTIPAPRPRGKLPARYAAIVMPLVLSVLMTFVVSAISTLRSLGPTPAFVATWPAAWAISWLVAFPTLARGAAAGAKDRGVRRRDTAVKLTQGKTGAVRAAAPVSIPQPVRDGLAHHVGQRLA